jgi:malonyl-CoA/methylmalonyl-CoA synthetase
VEQSLGSLPYVSEACVLAIPDHEARELCAAVIRTTRNSEKINLARVRSDLKESLPTYMLPAILRILKDDEEIPRTVSGKAIKKTICKEFFATTDWWPHNNPPLDVEYCGNMPLVDGEMTPWDWSGTQRVY